MAGGGNKKKPTKSTNRKPIKQSPFVNGGLLSDWSPVTDSPPSKGKSKSEARGAIGSGSGGKSKASSSNSRIIESQKPKMNAVGYSYPQLTMDPLPDEGRDEHKKLDESDPILSVDSKTVVFVDQTIVKESETIKYASEYDTNSEVDDGVHRGLGFHEKEEPDTPCVDEKQGAHISDSSSSEEIETDNLSSPEKNSGFLSIGGVKVYTHDVSDVEDDEDDENESSESDDSSDSSDSDTSSDVSDDVNINDTVRKFGGIALQEASREYGMKKPRSRTKSQSQSQSQAKSIKFRGDTNDWSAIDDLMLVKDPRIAYKQKKKKHEKSNHSRRLPGEKKKQRQDTIALKRKERMIRRGVDLEQINSKLEQMVRNEGDIMSFQLMHSRDCSQVQRLASIYRLRSCSQGSGKRRFVTVTRSEQTGMPSTSDRVRLEKLIGDATITLNETPPAKITFNSSKKASKVKNGLSPLDSRLTKPKTNGESSNNKRKEKAKTVIAYAKQPVSFISCGHMEPEDKTGLIFNEPKPRDQTAYGAFENHTTGFGSRMMAKMGYVDGAGLGKDGTGISEPIVAIQRPKSLGLGAEVVIEETITTTQRVKGQSSGSGQSQSQSRVGSFERHTKGFGSKMMAKMGYVDGSGLGRESQGIVDPLVATRVPKSRGLGANG